MIGEIVRLCEEKGGATYSLYFGDQSGQPFYAVGADTHLSAFLQPLEVFDLYVEVRRFLEKARDLLRQYPRCCIGLWKGEDADGIFVYLDVSILIYDEQIARDFGAEGNQIWVCFI